MSINFPINPLHGQQYAPQGIPITWQFDSGRNAWRVLRVGPAWIDIVGKPDEFPPSEHEHPIDDVIGLQNILDVKQDISARGQINGYAPLNEDGKVPSNMLEFGALSWENIENKPAEFPPSPHTHPVAQISDSSSVGQQIVRAPTGADVLNIIGGINQDGNARVQVEKNSAIIGVRRSINFKEGTNVTLSILDDPGNEEVGVTINSGGGGGGGASITVSEVKPVAPIDSSMWLDVATGILFIYYNDGSTSQWIEALPYLNAMPAVFTKFDFPPAPIEGQLYNPIVGATWKWSATRGVWFAVSTTADAYTKAEADSKFVDIVGDVMTGPLSVVHPPTANTHAASKQYVDSIANATVSDTPPAGALDGRLWWESDTGLLYIRYNDGTSTQWVLAAPQPDFATYAPIVSPAFTGNPTAPTAATGDSDTSIATTAFVSASAVRYDIAQTLTAPQLIQARNNIYAAPFEALAYNGMQVNGGMEVSQEHGPGIPMTTDGYILDGWTLSRGGSMAVSAIQVNAIGLSGFPSHLALSVTTAQTTMGAADYVEIYQHIEGYRIARLGWGAAGAQPITVSFWTCHHRTGIYSVSITTSDWGRIYAATYTQNAADTWEYKTITVTGDVAGTWWSEPNNLARMTINFIVACGSDAIASSINVWLAASYLAAPGQVNGVAATSDVFRITGVTVLPGIQAPTAAQSPNIMRPYDQELVTCQRYFRWLSFNMLFQAYTVNESFQCGVLFPDMRVTPTIGVITADPNTTQASFNNLQNDFVTITPCSAMARLTSQNTGQCYVAGYRSSADARL